MKETIRTVTPLVALRFLVEIIVTRKECRINILIRKRIKITVLEEQTGTTGNLLEVM